MTDEAALLYLKLATQRLGVDHLTHLLDGEQAVSHIREGFSQIDGDTP